MERDIKSAFKAIKANIKNYGWHYDVEYNSRNNSIDVIPFTLPIAGGCVKMIVDVVKAYRLSFYIQSINNESYIHVF